MLDAIRFTMAAVARRDYVPGLTHFQIIDGRITSFNGIMSLSAPIDVDINARPHAAKFLAAVRTCQGVISLHLTPSGRLSIRAGKFKVHIECVPDDGPEFLKPDGKEVQLGDSFMTGIKLLAPVMGIDASRPWARGIKLSSQSMFATNNVVVAEFWHGTTLPIDVVIPSGAIDELLRIDEKPVAVYVTDYAATFMFENDRWLRTNLQEAASWPIEKIATILNNVGPQEPLPEGFFEAVESLKPFLNPDNQTVYITKDGISTSRHEGEGASFEMSLPTVSEMQGYGHKPLTVLGQVATAVDWSSYPRPCCFTHGTQPLRGVIVGQRL